VTEADRRKRSRLECENKDLQVVVSRIGLGPAAGRGAGLWPADRPGGQAQGRVLRWNQRRGEADVAGGNPCASRHTLSSINAAIA